MISCIKLKSCLIKLRLLIGTHRRGMFWHPIELKLCKKKMLRSYMLLIEFIIHKPMD